MWPSFSSVGTYVGFLLRQTESHKEDTEELMIPKIEAPMGEDDPPLYPAWVESGPSIDPVYRYNCPHGWKNPTTSETPENFLQKHYCPWCKNTEDAQLFSSRRWVDVTVNTVIGGWPIEEAKWETVGNYCTHRYASTYQCWKDEGCRYVGLCRTLHVPEWSDRGTNQYSGHMKSTQELHCLDDEDNLKGGWYYDRQNRHKFKKISYRTLKEKEDFSQIFK